MCPCKISVCVCMARLVYVCACTGACARAHTDGRYSRRSAMVVATGNSAFEDNTNGTTSLCMDMHMSMRIDICKDMFVDRGVAVRTGSVKTCMDM